MTSSNTTVKSPSRKVRPSPIQSAIIAADKAVIRAEKRKARSFKRIARLEASIAKTIANGGQFDVIIAALKANAVALRNIASVK